MQATHENGNMSFTSRASDDSSVGISATRYNVAERDGTHVYKHGEHRSKLNQRKRLGQLMQHAKRVDHRCWL